MDATIEELVETDRALVFGVGGGGDVVGAVPTARFLAMHGVDVVLGGLAWERPAIDPRGGPRPFDEIRNLEQVSGTVAVAGEDTATMDGTRFAESHVAAWYDGDVVLLDVTEGIDALVDGLQEACDAMGIDAVVGVDAGGDAVAHGDEDGVRSPLADGISLVALDRLPRPTVLGVIGYGSDGELTRDELEERLSAVAADGGLLGAWGVTPGTADAMDDLLDSVPTEASRVPVDAARGASGTREIRDGARTLEIGPASTVTFYLDTGAVADRSGIVAELREVDGFMAADRALRDAGFTTELPDDYER